MSTVKGTENKSEEGATETTVETVDYRSGAGEDVNPTKEKVGIVHLTREGRDSGGRGVLAGAAEAVSGTVQAAKDKVMGSGNK